MKIKQILQALLSSEDFSDHSTGKEDGNGSLHDKGCAFCEAWRAALYLLSDLSVGLHDVFEPGDKVTICGRAPGVVERVRTQIDVRLGGDGTAPRPVGTFAQEFVQAAPAETPEVFYSDRDGDIWKPAGTQLQLCDKATWEPLTGKYAYVVPEGEVRDHYGPLNRVTK